MPDLLSPAPPAWIKELAAGLDRQLNFASTPASTVVILETLQAVAARVEAETRQEDHDLRYLIWLAHGCSTGMLYGDDGEMQCNVCHIDFKRDAPADIRARLYEISLHKRAEQQAALVAPESPK